MRGNLPNVLSFLQQDTQTPNLCLGVSGANDPADRKLTSNDLKQNCCRAAAAECNRTGTLSTNESECIINLSFSELLKRCIIFMLVKGDPQKTDMNK